MLNHPNIVSMIGFSRGPDSSNIIVQPYMKYGSLKSVLYTPNPSVPEDWLTYGVLCRIGLDVAKSLNYLHNFKKNGVKKTLIHQDIKSSNILINCLDPSDPRPMALVSGVFGND